MIAKALVAAALLLAPVPVAPSSIITQSPVLQVFCPLGLGASFGSAFRVGAVIVSVDHVTNPGTCEIDGEKVKVLYTKGDFSILEGRAGPSLKIDCEGFKAGRKYIARGYARGGPEVEVELTGTGKYGHGFAILRGLFTVIPGQSGGPIVDAETGKAVGTVNVYDYPAGRSGSIELKDTPLCRSSS